MDKPEYSVINMNTFPGEMKLKGVTLKAQAQKVNYQDIPRDIQIMREQTYAKEAKRGEFVKEFNAWAGLSDLPAGIVTAFGNVVPILVVLGVLGGLGFVAYKFWPRKKISARRHKRSR